MSTTLISKADWVIAWDGKRHVYRRNCDVAFAADSRKDKGSVRFELLQDLSRKNHFSIVEVWESQAAFDIHLEAAHSKQFREKLQPMLGSPFDERLHSIMQ